VIGRDIESGDGDTGRDSQANERYSGTLREACDLHGRDRVITGHAAQGTAKHTRSRLAFDQPVRQVMALSQGEEGEQPSVGAWGRNAPFFVLFKA
jgi:hypothetical protein